MTLEQYEKATPLINQLSNIDKAIKSTKAMIEKFNTEVKISPKIKIPCTLSESRNGSGASVDMTDCDVANAMTVATLEVLRKKKAEVEAAIESI